jgi:hypothetical protein
MDNHNRQKKRMKTPQNRLDAERGRARPAADKQQIGGRELRNESSISSNKPAIRNGTKKMHPMMNRVR